MWVAGTWTLRAGAELPGHLKQASKMDCEVDWGLRLRV